MSGSCLALIVFIFLDDDVARMQGDFPRTAPFQVLFVSWNMDWRSCWDHSFSPATDLPTARIAGSRRQSDRRRFALRGGWCGTFFRRNWLSALHGTTAFPASGSRICWGMLIRRGLPDGAPKRKIICARRLFCALPCRMVNPTSRHQRLAGPLPAPPQLWRICPRCRPIAGWADLHLSCDGGPQNICADHAGTRVIRLPCRLHFSVLRSQPLTAFLGPPCWRLCAFAVRCRQGGCLPSKIAPPDIIASYYGLVCIWRLRPGCCRSVRRTLP